MGWGIAATGRGAVDLDLGFSSWPGAGAAKLALQREAFLAVLQPWLGMVVQLAASLCWLAVLSY